MRDAVWSLLFYHTWRSGVVCLPFDLGCLKYFDAVRESRRYFEEFCRPDFPVALIVVWRVRFCRGKGSSFDHILVSHSVTFGL